MSATVAITIAGRSYEMACDAGQEKILEDFSHEIDKRAQQLLKAVGPVSDSKLLVMVALTLVDDLTEARGRSGPAAEDKGDQASAERKDEAVAAGIERLAARIEAIADRVQKA